MGRSLTPVELAAYDHIPEPLARRVRVITTPVLAPGADGMTFGPYVLVKRDDDRSGRSILLAHELVHVRQYAEAGWAGFLATYLIGYLRRLVRLRNHNDAYLAIPAEAEARESTSAWARRHLRR